MNPEGLNKYLYVEKTPTWLVRAIFAISIFAWVLVLYGYSGIILYDPVYRWTAGPVLLFFSVYYFSSYGLNLFYTQYNVPEHAALIEQYWALQRVEPPVDIFLPICDESLTILRNTWHHVSRLKYENRRVYVLDDSRSGGDEHQRIAESYGFIYLSRLDKGWMKKSGNLRHAFEHTNGGDFIAVFDADFAPHPDFLRELLPYTSDPKVGIVQSPQYFETTKAMHDRSPLEYGAARVQEAFYRYIQVVRSRFGATICCGSNAIYRRTALESIGGFVLAEHSEDAWTGFELSNHGWQVLYVPIILAIGLCPSDPHSYFHQQHRWGSGSLSLVLSNRFWQSKLTWKAKCCYGVGLLFYLSQPLAIIFSFQLFYFLFVYNGYISLGNGMLFYPAMVWGYLVLFFFSISRFRWGVLLALFMQMYSYSHAIFARLLKSTVGWIPTNAKYGGITAAFKQATLAVGVYVAAYLALTGLAVHNGMLHLFNYNYFFLQFWMFYNLTFAGMLLWWMYRAMETVRGKQIADGTLSHSSLMTWQMKTAGLYTVLLLGAFFGIMLL